MIGGGKGGRRGAKDGKIAAEAISLRAYFEGS
jgi:hypothetical protein